VYELTARHSEHKSAADRDPLTLCSVQIANRRWRSTLNTAAAMATCETYTGRYIVYTRRLKVSSSLSPSATILSVLIDVKESSRVGTFFWLKLLTCKKEEKVELLKESNGNV